MNDDQELVNAVIKRYALGAGAVLGSGDANQQASSVNGASGCYGAQPSVAELLSLGSCTLALARARGVLRPWALTTTATFQDDLSAGAELPALNPSNDDKIAQDSYVAGISYKLLNMGSPGQPSAQPQYDFFFNFQSGIELTMMLKGAPGGNPIPAFTPISALPSIMNRGWVMRRTEWPQCSFVATIDLPYITKVQVVFGLWAPVSQDGELYRNPRQAAAALKEEFGIDVGC